MKGILTGILLVAILLIPSGVSVAQDAGGAAQAAAPGDFWKDLRPDQKALFTLGYATGVDVFSKFVPGPCDSCETSCLEDAKSRLVPIGTGIPDVVQILDSIYGDEANKNIPVMWAFKLAAQKVAGIGDDEWRTALIEAQEDSAPTDTP